MKHIINIVVGDWSGDGHNVTSTFVMKSNFSREEMKAAYEIATEMVGFDITKHLCQEHEDWYISAELVEKFQGFGISLDLEEDFENDERFEMTPEDFVNLYIKLINLSAQGFEHEMIKGVDVNIGGYGLLGM